MAEKLDLGGTAPRLPLRAGGPAAGPRAKGAGEQRGGDEPVTLDGPPAPAGEGAQGEGGGVTQVKRDRRAVNRGQMMRWRKRPPEDNFDDMPDDARRVERMFEAQEKVTRRILRRRRFKWAVLFLATSVLLYGFIFLTMPFPVALAEKAGKFGWLVILLYSILVFSPVIYVFQRWGDQIEEWFNR